MKSLILTGLLLCTATAIWGGDEKLAADLRARNPRGSVDVIVRYKATPTDAQHQKVTQAGGALKSRLDFIRSAFYSVSPALLKKLSDDADVEYITPDRPVHGMLNITAGTVYSNVANASGLTGQGIGIALIDSGIALQPDFQNGRTERVVYQQSFVPASPIAVVSTALALKSTTTYDQYGHGTHVAGILAANGNGTVYVGMAPDVNLINLRVLDQNGNGTDTSVIAAIDEAIQLKNQYNIRVMNISLGRPVYESASNDPLCQAVEAAWSAGIVVVVAAGNDGRDNSQGTMGYGTITAPGNDPRVITVGAMNSMGTTTRNDDIMTSYSSKGPTLFDQYVKPDIMAPGNQITSLLSPGSTLVGEYPGNVVGNNHFTLSGTSMATPVVAGAAALLLQQTSWLSPDQVKARLMKTATKNFPVSSVVTDPVTNLSYTIYYDIFTVGAGYLNITAALADNSVASGPATSPQAVYNGATGQIGLQGVSGSNVVWGSNVIWGTNVVWGTTVLLANNVVATNVVWGDNVVWGSLQALNVIWGTNVVWGTSTTDASEATTLAINGEPF